MQRRRIVGEADGQVAGGDVCKDITSLRDRLPGGSHDERAGAGELAERRVGERHDAYPHGRPPNRCDPNLHGLAGDRDGSRLAAERPHEASVRFG